MMAAPDRLRTRVHAGGDKPIFVRAMFDGIARRYDVMNRLMTGGFDVVARTITARAVAGPTVRIAVDMGCGTGDLSFALARSAPCATVVGLDFSAGMLGMAARKRLRDASGARVPLVRGDGTALGIADGSADALVSAWVLRNVRDLAQTFREARRVLRPGGRAAFLELTPVKSRVFGPLFRMYFHGVVPWVGERMSGHPAAYTYLPESVDRFPDAETMQKIVDVHFPGLKKELLTAAMKTFYDVRNLPGLKKKPSTSELLDWLKLLVAEDIPLDALQSKDEKVSMPPLVGALLKNEQDVTLFEKLVFMQRNNR